MNKKYEILTDESIDFNGRTLYRIKSLNDFGNVHKGDLGGFVMSEDNLSHDGNCWIYDNAKCLDNARVLENAMMHDNACMYHNSKMYGNSEMFDNSVINNFSCMFNNSKIYNYSRMEGTSYMFDKSEMYGNSKIKDGELNNDAKLTDNMVLCGRLYSKCDKFYNFIENNECRTVVAVLKDGQILYNVGCQREITEDTFLYRIYNHNGGIKENPHRKEYLKIIEASKILLR